MTVRSATVDDAPAMARIKVDGWQTAYRGLLPDPVLDVMDAASIAADFARWIAEPAPGSGCLVAEGPSGVVGYAVLGRYRWDDLPDAGEVYALYVHPLGWGSGSGRALLTAAEGQLRDAGLAEAALWVLAGNGAGRAFYEALGWHADGAVGEHCEAGDAPEIRYRRVLTG